MHSVIPAKPGYFLLETREYDLAKISADSFRKHAVLAWGVCYDVPERGPSYSKADPIALHYSVSHDGRPNGILCPDELVREDCYPPVTMDEYIERVKDFLKAVEENAKELR